MVALGRIGFAITALAVAVGCASEPALKPSGGGPIVAARLPKCQGSAHSCSKRLNEIVFPTAHNAMSSAAASWFLPNQPDGLLLQLEHGIRGLMLDVHPYDGDDVARKGKPMLCHGFCAGGSRDLAEALSEIWLWMQSHPRELIVLVLEDYVPETAIDAALVASQLRQTCIERAPGAHTATLGTLLAANTRVLIMTESSKGKLLWNFGYEAIAFDTPYAAETAKDFSCNVLRGKPGNAFFVVNHFLTKGLTNHAELADQVNHNPLLADRVKQCETAQSHRANLIAVDWYTTGDVVALAATLNQQP